MHRISFRLLTLATGCLLALNTAVQQAQTPATPRKASAPAAAAKSSARNHDTETVQDLMVKIISPASKVAFDAVSTETTPTGTVEKYPKTDAEWAVVKQQALAMVEGANLIMVPGRAFSSPEEAQKHAEGELPPAEIEKLVAKDRQTWNKMSLAFRAAANKAVIASGAKRKQDFGAVNDGIDTACENCHLRFWYPDQEEMLKNAPKSK